MAVPNKNSTCMHVIGAFHAFPQRMLVKTL